ncbi:MAG: hypothetical protein CMP21_00805 [Rickettsiales bacterium]|nr:hypothetical protein [Rickettsiales bacterium]|tara:strand:+ start:5877 stop:7121 length:1245 start_codon:yes stop_codon:yes gene_type:complete
MLKQSVLYVFLQFLNILVGVYVTFYIAQNVDTQIFSILAIYTIINGIFMTFSFLGYETVLLRNALYWERIGCKKKIVNYVTYSLVSRLIIGLVLIIPVVGYCYYLACVKFDNNYFFLLSSFSISGIFFSLANSNALILKSFNKYILSFSIMAVSLIIGRLVSVYMFLNYGFFVFIIILVCIPVLIFFVSFRFISKYFSLKYIKFRYFLKFKNNKYFVFSGYLNYFKLSIDQLLVSIFLSVEVLAVYNLAKKIEEIGKSLVEGFFDPMIQKLVTYKDDLNLTKVYKEKLYKIKNIFLVFISICVVVFNVFIDQLISVANLDHFQHLSYYLVFSSWTVILYTIYKVSSNIIYLFDNQKTLYKIDIFVGTLSIFFTILFFMDTTFKYIFLNRIFTGLVLCIFFHYFYKRFFIKKFCF